MTRARTNADQAHTESVESIPHIIPGVLYPAVAGKDLSGTALGGSYTYGTAHTDGRSYYYTDIKGSKPIKDPRIGAHFGSQRYPCKSVQLLEQETATHGEKVHSIDGREWMRVVGSAPATTNNAHGQYTHLGNTSGDLKFIEIVGYFNQATMSSYTNTHATRIITETVVNGGSAHTTDTSHVTSTTTPLASRYVDAGSVKKIEMETITSPQITTLKLVPVDAGYIDLYNIELIAQDTTSTANRSKIQIPSQNVVSYGKKFTVSGTPHYDPFNGFTSGNLAAVQALIDTDTSLGMANWLSSSTYYRPFNGGRVVKWVDSSGNIKTSVTMMPPNAQNIAGSASNAHTLGNANDQTINFDTTTIANATPLFEVAKTFMALEFGNGAANGGTGATYADATMLHTDGTADDIAYVMDDGLTSLSGDNTARSAKAIIPNSDDDYNYFTFIGTGVSINDPNGDSPGQYYPAQNMPYGTHILKSTRKSGTNAVEFVIDGVNLGTQSNCTKGRCEEITFYQPKKPPIPEDAVVLADYCLMADYVQNTSATTSAISKGVRRNGGTRDHFYDCGGAIDAINGAVLGAPFMFVGPGSHSSNAMPVTLPYFGTSFTDYANNKDNSHSFTLDGSSVTPTGVDTDIVGGDMFYHAVSTLGLHIKVHTVPAGGDRFTGTDVASPIHTSSHYQSFETPYLHELVGGDRNMEQHNLIVTPDGKSWDEVTRDTSYLGDGSVHTSLTLSNHSSTATIVYDKWRGFEYSTNYYNKDFAIAYDRIICLKEGQYHVHFQGHTFNNGDAGSTSISLNDTVFTYLQTDPDSSERGSHSGDWNFQLKRGDYIKVAVTSFRGDARYNHIAITRN